MTLLLREYFLMLLFIDDALAKANIFVKSALLPELIGRWFTKQQSASESVPPVTQTIPDHGSTPTIADASSTTDDTILSCSIPYLQEADLKLCKSG